MPSPPTPLPTGEGSKFIAPLPCGERGGEGGISTSLPGRFLCSRFCHFGCLIDLADVHERAFRQVIPLAIAQLFKATDCILECGEITALSGKRLGHEERLRQEPLD